MANGRRYSVEFAAVAVTAVQDLITILAGTAPGSILLHEARLAQQNGVTSQNLNVSIKRLPATVTPGSGGSTPTPQALVPGDAAATATAHVNDTSRSTTGGTAATLVADAFNTINGWMYLPAPEDRILVQRTQALVLSLDTAPSASMNISGSLVFEELF